MGENEEDDGKRKPNKAKEEDEWFRHPYTGSFIRNPLRIKDEAGTPIILAKEDFDHNCLDEALYGWKQIRVDESSFNEMISNTGSQISPRTMKKRAQIHRIHTLDEGFEFIVTLDKAEFTRGVSKEQQRGRRKKEPPKLGTKLEKLEIEVNEMGNKALRIESVAEGLVAAWNRMNPGFLVQVSDLITCVNGKKKPADMIEELDKANILRLTMKHGAGPKVDDMTMLPGRASSKGKVPEEEKPPPVVVPPPSEPPKQEEKAETLKAGTGTGGTTRKIQRSMPPPRPVMSMK